MDEICERCGATGCWSPDDHDCASNLTRQVTKVLQGITIANLPRSNLLEAEARLADLYESLRSLTAHYSNEAERAREKRDEVYIKKQDAARPLNAVRAEIRERMGEVK